MTIPLLMAFNERWKETPPASVSLAVVVAFLRGFAGKKGRAKAPDGKDAPAGSNLVGDMIGQLGVGFSEKPRQRPLDPAGLMKKA